MAHLFKNLFKSRKMKHETPEYDEKVLHQLAQSGHHTRYLESTDLHPAAPYHKMTAPKMSRGPKSCPGGSSSRPPCFPIDLRESYMEYPRHKQRGFSSSSEYGSGDPSPTLRTQLHRYVDLDDSDEMAEHSRRELKHIVLRLRMKLDEEKQQVQYEREKRHMCKQTMKEYEKKLHESEKRFAKIRDILQKERQEKANLQKRIELLELEKRQMEVLGMREQPSVGNLFPPFPLLSSNVSSSSPRGAGESLANNSFNFPFINSSDHQDEMRCFRSIETARGGGGGVSASSMSVPPAADVSLLREDDGYSTTTTSLANDDRPIRRVLSDPGNLPH